MTKLSLLPGKLGWVRPDVGGWAEAAEVRSAVHIWAPACMRVCVCERACLGVGVRVCVCQTEKDERMLSFQKRRGDISQDVLSGGRGTVGDPAPRAHAAPWIRACGPSAQTAAICLAFPGGVCAQRGGGPGSQRGRQGTPRGRALLVSAQVSPGAGPGGLISAAARLPLPARPLLPARPSPAPPPPPPSDS